MHNYADHEFSRPTLRDIEPVKVTCGFYTFRLTLYLYRLS